MIVRNKLREVRKNKRLTQAEIAEKAAISERAYQRYENGERLPDILTALLLAKILKSEVKELFYLCDDENN